MQPHLIKPKRIICIGDSITEGYLDSKGLGWPGRLALKLSEEKPMHYQVNNLGIGNDHSANVQRRIFGEVCQRTPDFLIIGVGINDMQDLIIRNGQSYGTSQSLNWSEMNWRKILDTVKKQQLITLVWGLLPVDPDFMPLKYDPDTYGFEAYDYRNEDIEAYNKMLQSLCKTYDIPFLDVYNDWQNRNLKDLMDDGLHPNDMGYDLLANQIYSAFKILMAENEVNIFLHTIKQIKTQKNKSQVDKRHLDDMYTSSEKTV